STLRRPTAPPSPSPSSRGPRLLECLFRGHRLELASAPHDGILIRVNPVSGRKPHTAELQGFVLESAPLCSATPGRRSQALHPDVECFNALAVANDSVDHDTRPVVGHCNGRQAVAQNTNSHRTPGVYHQYTTLAGIRQHFKHRAVILVGQHRSARP